MYIQNKCEVLFKDLHRKLPKVNGGGMIGSPISIKFFILKSNGFMPISTAACSMIASIIAAPLTIPGALVAVGGAVCVLTPYGIYLQFGIL